MNSIGIWPLLDTVYVKSVSTFPIDFDKISHPVGCVADGVSFTIKENPFLNGVPGRYKVSCPGHDALKRKPVILREYPQKYPLYLEENK